MAICYSQTEKIASKFGHVRNRSDFVATNRHEIPASLHGRFGIAAKIAGVNRPLKSDSLYDKMTSNMVRMHGGG